MTKQGGIEMDLLNRQIEAVRETLGQVLEEYNEGKVEHCWAVDRCPLCRFICEECPFVFYLGSPCFYFARRYWEKRDYNSVSLQDIAGFLQSLLISLEGMK